MKLSAIMKQPSAFLPVAMSLAALVTLLVAFATGGLVRETDEGAAAHIWQLLMGGQIPIVAYFAISGCRRLQGRRFTYWRYKLDSQSQHLHRFTCSTFRPRGRLHRAD